MDAVSAHDPEIVSWSVSLKWDFQKIGEGRGMDISRPTHFMMLMSFLWDFMVATCT